MNMEFNPKFVRHFGEIGQAMIDAYQSYHRAVQDESFPAAEESYVKSDCSDEYLAELDREYQAKK